MRIAQGVISKWCGTDSKVHAYPGAVILVVKKGKILVNRAFGFKSIYRDPVPMSIDCVFDLASLTKAIATTTAALILIDSGEIRLNDKVEYFASCLKGYPLGESEIKHILTQTLGFTNWVPLFRSNATRDNVPFFMRQTGFSWPPGTRIRYSCPGFILLGWIIERITGKRLDVFTKEMIFDPLEMNDTMFLPLDQPIPKGIRERLVPTESRSSTIRGNELAKAFRNFGQKDLHYQHSLKDEWDLRHIEGGIPCGVVHDENAAWLWGVAGNAGLFSTASDLGKFGEMYLNEGIYGKRRILSERIIHSAYQNWTQGLPGDECRGFSWQFATPGGSLGDFAPSGCFGHTGFTGTVIWIDPKNKVTIVLLTNRLQFTRENQHILKVRRLFANAVFKEIEIDS